MFNRKTIITIISAFVSVSLFGVLLMTIDRFWNFEGTADGWLGYWGGIIGSAIGVIGALFVLQSQLKSDKEARKEEKVDNTFFNLLNLFNAIQDELLMNNKYFFENIHNSLFNSMQSSVTSKQNDNITSMWSNIINEIRKGQNLLSESAKLLVEEYERVSWTPEDFLHMSMLENTSEAKKISEEDSKELGILKRREKRNEQTTDSVMLIRALLSEEDLSSESYRSIIKNMYRLRSILQELELLNMHPLIKWLNELLSKMDKFSEVQFDELEKREIIYEGMRSYNSESGKYFRMFNRIVKYINDNVEDINQRKNYVGFLRAMVNEKEIVILYYNSFFTDRGNGLGEELRKTKFFGDTKDLEKGKVSHFSDDLLLWPDEDLKKMRMFKYE